LRPDLRSAATYLLKILLGDFTGRDLRKKALAAWEIENRAFELVGRFIDQPETGEVIPKVLANRCCSGAEQLIGVQLGHYLIVDFEQQTKAIALLR
jgi:hypothetical protein